LLKISRFVDKQRLTNGHTFMQRYKTLSVLSVVNLWQDLTNDLEDKWKED